LIDRSIDLGYFKAYSGWHFYGLPYSLHGKPWIVVTSARN